MRDDLIGDAAGVAPDASCIECDRAVETLGLHRRWRRRGRSRWAGAWHRSRRPFTTDSWPRGRTTYGRLHALGVQLLARDLRFHKQPRRLAVSKRHNLPTAQATITAGALVEAVGESETLSLPGQQREPLADRAKKHRRVRKPRQIKVPGKVFGELLDCNAVAAPERYLVQIHAQPRGSETSEQQLVAAQLLARTHRKRVLPTEPQRLPLNRSLRR